MLILLNHGSSAEQLIKFYGLLKDTGIYKIGVLVQINTSEHPRPVIKPAVEKLNGEPCGAEKLCNFIAESASEYFKYWTAYFIGYSHLYSSIKDCLIKWKQMDWQMQCFLFQKLESIDYSTISNNKIKHNKWIHLINPTSFLLVYFYSGPVVESDKFYCSCVSPAGGSVSLRLCC